MMYVKLGVAIPPYLKVENTYIYKIKSFKAVQKLAKNEKKIISYDNINIIYCKLFTIYLWVICCNNLLMVWVSRGNCTYKIF